MQLQVSELFDRLFLQRRGEQLQTFLLRKRPDATGNPNGVRTVPICQSPVAAGKECKLEKLCTIKHERFVKSRRVAKAQARQLKARSEQLSQKHTFAVHLDGVAQL